jgi:hypothetical protein
MATTTPNFGWSVPTSTDLVKDGATAIETLGDSIDASLVDLKGGTTGQVLSKASNTDMDFTWVTDAAGDITGVTAGTGISGGGTSGTVTVTNSMATAITTNGDLIYGTGSGTFSRLGIGSSGQMLSVSSGVPSWATVAASGMTLISATTCTSVSSQAVTAFSSTYTNYRIIYSGNGTADQTLHMKLRSGSTDSSTAYYYYSNRYFSSNATNSAAVPNGVDGFEVGQTFAATSGVIEVYQPFEAQRTSMHAIGQNFSTSATRSVSVWSSGVHNASTSYDGFNLIFLAGAFTGTIFVYGYKKS